ncbi:hypothetical protein VTL71DRAFT_8078 [Oculimacula yallundae]|uniref:NACHT domain-containing protein n=1 Tax=Oculimacula yallundae TaxID=86028 RepID=A0ABR4CWN9_9HELO
MLQIWAGERKLTMASFFFWISGDADQCSQTGLLRSLLHCLLLQHRRLIQEVFPDLWEQIGDANRQVQLKAWSHKYTLQALKNLLSRDLGKVVLFVDGLDEYHGDHTDHLHRKNDENCWEIVELIKSLSSPNRVDLKMCFSSRPLPIFHKHFDDRLRLRLQDLTYNDVQLYTKDKLYDNPIMAELRKESPRELLRTVKEIVRQAEGVFLWVFLVVRSLLNGATKSDNIKMLRKRLSSFPSGLNELYRHMLDQIEPCYRAEGWKMFAIVDADLDFREHHTLRTSPHVSLYGKLFELPPLCLLGLWFGLEYSNLRHLPETLSQSLSSKDEIVKACRRVDLMMKTCCGGLLETGRTQANDENLTVIAGTLGNRTVHYLHRTAKDFIELANSEDEIWNSQGYDADPSLLWSAIQKMEICKLEMVVNKGAATHLLDVTKSALMLAIYTELRGKTCQTELLDLLDICCQGKHTQLGCSIMTIIMYELHHNHPCYDQPPKYFTMSVDTHQLDDTLGDDFLSLAIVCGLDSYARSKIVNEPTLVKKKLGRPYLDYALTTCDQELLHLRPSIIPMLEMLLEAGASPDELCSATNSALEVKTGQGKGNSSGRHSYHPWTPWKSALSSVLTSKFKHFSNEFDHWVLYRVLRTLLDKGPDVSVITQHPITFISDSNYMRLYTVSELIETTLGSHDAEGTAELLAMVEKLASAQGCALYSQDTLSRTHQEAMTEVNNTDATFEDH